MTNYFYDEAGKPRLRPSRPQPTERQVPPKEEPPPKRKLHVVDTPPAPEPEPPAAVLHVDAGDVPLPPVYEPHAASLVTVSSAWCMVTAATSIAAEDAAELRETVAQLKAELASVKLANAELRAALAETTAKSNETSFFVSRLRIENKGDRGPQGLMGPPGRDGARGEKGEKGNRGQRGEQLSCWEINTEAYTITPRYYSDATGPSISLRPFFERYNEETEEDEVANSTAQMELTKADLALRIARVNAGRPERG
jgi:hypothetical protein